jgi:hypothetical protein
VRLDQVELCKALRVKLRGASEASEFQRRMIVLIIQKTKLKAWACY